MLSKAVFPCNTCNLNFENSQAQRTHMREPWHVYNLKRRMASLPPISADSYAENVATSVVVSSKQEPSFDAASSSAVVRRPSPEEERVAEESGEFEEDLISERQSQINRCLFCTKDSSDSLETNLEHMSSEHGLYIPELEHLSSLETIVGYLRTVITEYNECLYCGTIKQSAEGIRRHMLDKGHCMINLEREPELLEFWEFSDDSDGDGHDDTEDDNEEAPKARRDRKTDTTAAASRDLSQVGEYTLPSGKVVGSKSKAREARFFACRTASSATKETSSRTLTEEGPIDNGNTDKTSSSADPAESLITRTQGGEGTQDRAAAAAAVRDAAGLVGVSGQQMRSLITLRRKMQRQQAIVRASAAWADEKGGRHQKHYKVKMNLRAG